MAYFSNGSEGMDYMDRYCSRCRNFRTRDGGKIDWCPVWEAHIAFAYEECNNDGAHGPITNAKTILDMLIPQGGDGFADECAMFLDKDNAR